eukprot:SM000106S13985  [mRNA]  locus=s106:425972:430759:+ [translate_table: standard]
MLYGVCAADLDGDGKTELFVCGFGTENLLLKQLSASLQCQPNELFVVQWNGQMLENIAKGTPLEDLERRAIGVTAGDFDGDGQEELYVLNTDTFLGRKKLTDRLFDRTADGYGFFVANYGGVMKLFEMGEDNFVVDSAADAGLVKYPTGGRALVALPLISQFGMDVFAGNEGGPNFLFCNKNDGSGRYVECAAAFGLMDAEENCRGVAVLDVDGSGELGLATGNWQGPHRLFAPAGPGPRGGASALGFKDVSPEAGGFKDVAPPSMAKPSPIRTVIAADFDNDGLEELFFNNIGSPNRLFRQDGPGRWVEENIGDAEEANGLGTGAAVADIDGDGRLELLVAHGELRPQPLSFYRPPTNNNAWLRIRPLTKQGAPARGASVYITDETGRSQRRVIDAGSLWHTLGWDNYVWERTTLPPISAAALKLVVDLLEKPEVETALSWMHDMSYILAEWRPSKVEYLAASDNTSGPSISKPALRSMNLVVIAVWVP